MRLGLLTRAIKGKKGNRTLLLSRRLEIGWGAAIDVVS
jgi:hypothetical protein